MNTTKPEAPMLETRDLSRAFGHGDHMVRAVDRVSFSMQTGEIVAVVGESGSGKSTLARLLLRLLDPTGGQILLHGQDVTTLHHRGELKTYWQKVQGAFQDSFAAFNQFYTVRRSLEKALNVLDVSLSKSDRTQRIETSLREVGLDPADILDKWPHQLSGGQLQRVMIARALVVGPELLIADEPTSMLDASLRVTVLNLLLDLRKSHNMSILFITHDLGQANYLSDRILVMYRGELVEQGPVEQVLADPQHEYTQRLLADVPRLRGKSGVPA
ncbi:MAG: ATP-binding cassette domain-containing protein [Anaerolineae bacterium]|nr:ATP-binding cassette domain-containing protein [Anaerolineae bacterium]